MALISMFGCLLLTISIIFYTGAFFFINNLLHFFKPEINKKDRLWASNWLVSGCQASLATAMGLYSMRTTGMDIIHTRVPLLKAFGWFSLGYWLYDLVLMFILVTFHKPDRSAKESSTEPKKNQAATGDTQGEKPAKKNMAWWELMCYRVVRFVVWWPGIVFHHVGIILFLVLGILATNRVRGDGIVGVAMLMELSSLFVALRSALKSLALQGSFLHVLVSILMVISHAAVRIVMVPVIIQVYCWQASQSLWVGVTLLPLPCQIGTTLFYSLNMYWFWLMLKGVAKSVKTGKES